MLPLIISTEPGLEAPSLGIGSGSEVIPSRFRSGVLTVTPKEGGPALQADTVSCIHCAFTWVPRPGSGKRRGFCTHCNGFLCGRPACVALGCVHREQLLDNIEAGRRLNFVPIVVHIKRG